jgi:hydroxyacylglutathione hydrolase
LHNIRFALTLEPGNQKLVQRKYDTEVLRDAALPSLPSSISLELETNPFLRCFSTEIRSSVQLQTAPPVEVFRTIREMRNHY